MLIEQTLEKMNVMKLSGMAEGLRQQLGSAEHVKLAFDDRLGLLVDAEWIAREQRKLAMKAVREAEWAGQPRPTVKVSPHSTFGRGM